MNKINRVLFIDDDAANNFLNQMLVEDLGFAKNISFALNGQEALDILERCTDEAGEENSFPELMFVDINMPVMDGFEFMEAFAKAEKWKNKSVMVCMLTTSLNPSDREKADNINAIQEFVPKPLTQEGLQDLLAKHF